MKNFSLNCGTRPRLSCWSAGRTLTSMTPPLLRVNPSQELASEDREKHTRETSTLEGSARTKPPFQAIVRVRSGSQADILGGLRDVRYSPASSTGRRNTPSEWEKVERGR